jgi:hypothetical protein
MTLRSPSASDDASFATGASQARQAMPLLDLHGGDLRLYGQPASSDGGALGQCDCRITLLASIEV